ncbi:hypothetical protein AAMO2058_001755400, partial [Amorphochlora amoebiformis]
VHGFQYFESPPEAKTPRQDLKPDIDLVSDKIGIFHEGCRILHPKLEEKQTRADNLRGEDHLRGDHLRGFDDLRETDIGGLTQTKPSTQEPKRMKISEMKRILSKYRVDTRVCLSREDLENKLKELRKRQKEQARIQIEAENRRREEKRRERIQHQSIQKIQRWANGKSLRQLLNSVRGLKGERCPLSPVMSKRGGSSARGVYLDSHASQKEIVRAYKRALVLIHPDKFDLNDIQTYTMATETFKAVNAAFVQFNETHSPTC